jgi:hypothetical protein
MSTSAGGQAPWASQAGNWGGAAPAPAPAAAAPPPPPAQAAPDVAPLRKIDRTANWSMVCAFASIIFGFLTLVPALILAFRAQSMAHAYTYTTANSRVRWAKWLAIGLTVLWALWLALIIAAAVSSPGSSGA